MSWAFRLRSQTYVDFLVTSTSYGRLTGGIRLIARCLIAAAPSATIDQRILQPTPPGSSTSRRLAAAARATITQAVSASVNPHGCRALRRRNARKNTSAPGRKPSTPTAATSAPNHPALRHVPPAAAASASAPESGCSAPLAASTPYSRSTFAGLTPGLTRNTTTSATHNTNVATATLNGKIRPSGESLRLLQTA